MKTYTGKRTPLNCEVLVLENGGGRVLEVEPSLKIRSHSPTGFEWGYTGSGPSQLALAILIDATKDCEYALNNYQCFKETVVSKLPKDGWTFTSDQVLQWRAGGKWNETRETTTIQNEKVIENALKIVALIDSPHWDNGRRSRIRDLAMEIMAIVRKE